DLIIGPGHMVSAAEIDPIELPEEGTQHGLHGVPGALEWREILLAKAVHMEAIDPLHMLRQQLSDRKAKPAAGRCGVIFCDLSFAVHRVDAQADVEPLALRAKRIEERAEARDLAWRIEDQLIG